MYIIISKKMTQSSVSSSERFTGRVKWFNNKAGYGFVTVTDGPNSGKDVFVHHTAIKVDSEQYKYLVQGEYIEFSFSDAGSVGGHEYQAGDVSGIKGGKLMCETRNESRTARVQYKTHSTEESKPLKPKPRARAPREQSVSTQKPSARRNPKV
jgi:CspA family cold shock protein